MSISVIIPAFGEQENLLRSLATLEAQKDEFDECIVVDDGSPELLEVPDWVDLIRVEREPMHRGSSMAKNWGATEAKGEYLMFADSDILHMSDALASLKKAAEKMEAEGFEVMLTTPRVGLPDYHSHGEIADLEELYSIYEVVGSVYPMSNCCRQMDHNAALVRADTFWKVGGYDEDTFKSWGYNNHGLNVDLAVMGVLISSYVPRISNGKRLHCFHLWHENECDKDLAEKEFSGKYGFKYKHEIFNDLQNMGLVKRYGHEILAKFRLNHDGFVKEGADARECQGA